MTEDRDLRISPGEDFSASGLSPEDMERNRRKRKGRNVARLSWLDSHGGPRSRISEQPDGTYAAVPAGGAESEEDISRGQTVEDAAAARIALLESQGVYVPEPPEEYVSRIIGD